MTVSYALHDKTSDKFVTQKCMEEITADVTFYFRKNGGTLITYEELSDVENLPEEFVTACKGTAGVSIISIDFYATTSGTGKQGQPGATDTYKIKLSDGTYTSFMLYNGLKIEDTMTIAEIKAYLDNAMSNLIGGAPDLLNTLEELATVFGNDPEAFNALVLAVSKKAEKTYVDDVNSNLLLKIDAMLDIETSIFGEQHTLGLEDRGKNILTSEGIVVPDNASVGFKIGTTITITNTSIGKLIVSPLEGVTLIWAGTTKSGARNLLNYGICTLIKTDTDVWFINGHLE